MIRDGARHFEDFDGLTYLNCAYIGPLPRVTIQAIQDALPLQAHPNRVDDASAFRIPDRIRQVTAPFLGARPEDILVGSGASHGMAVGALGYPWKAGDQVVLAANDFPSNLYLWIAAARRHGGERILVQGRRHAATTDEILAAITPRTRIVSVSWVDFGSGEIVDLERLGQVCASRGIFLAVDGTQGVGVLPLDVKALRISLLVVGAYKWMLAPYGAGFAYLDPAWGERIAPSYVTWTAARGAEDYNALPRDGWKWVETARRYDGPETASYLNRAGFIRSAEFLADIGRPAVHEHVTGLLDQLERGLPAPFRRRAGPSPIRGPILSIEADDVAAVHGAYQRLREERFRVSLRDDGIRVSPHIYNTEGDMERLLRVLGNA
jgi:selenocysteine lyase/cysteine desulfurase